MWKHYYSSCIGVFFPIMCFQMHCKSPLPCELHITVAVLMWFLPSMFSNIVITVIFCEKIFVTLIAHIQLLSCMFTLVCYKTTFLRKSFATLIGIRFLLTVQLSYVHLKKNSTSGSKVFLLYFFVLISNLKTDLKILHRVFFIGHFNIKILNWSKIEG